MISRQQEHFVSIFECQFYKQVPAGFAQVYARRLEYHRKVEEDWKMNYRKLPLLSLPI